MCVYLSGDNGIIRETRNGNPADSRPSRPVQRSKCGKGGRGEGASFRLVYRFLCFNGILLFFKALNRPCAHTQRHKNEKCAATFAVFALSAFLSASFSALSSFLSTALPCNYK